MEIPVLNCNRVYINANRISLLIENKKNYTVTKDGWSILKFCDGTRDVNIIYDIVRREFDIDKKNFVSFLENARKINILKFISNIERKEIHIFGGVNKLYPQSFAIELTNKCNLECKYCYGNYKRSAGSFMNINTIIRLFDDMSKNGVITVELTGGEPLLHPDFKEILLMALKRFYRVNILSNGVLFTEDIFRVIENDIDKIYLQISIDGCSEETNMQVRRVKNTWNKTLRTLKVLRDIGANYRVPFMITNDNICEIENVCQLFNQENLRNLVFSPVTASFGRACDYSECKFDSEKENYVYDTSQKMYKKYSGVFHKLLDYKNELPVAIDNCGSGWQHATISPIGIIKSCVMLDENSGGMGDIHKQSISEIFNSDKAAFYTNFSKKIDDSSCKSCGYNNLCGNCIARIYIANIERLKNGLGICDIVKKTNMCEYLDFDSDFKFNIH